MRYWSNCFIYALGMWRKYGGYLIIRWSRSLKGVPHFLWAPDGAFDDNQEVRHYTPLKPTTKPYAFWEALLFRGRVKFCDRRECPTDRAQCRKCSWRSHDAAEDSCR